LDSGTEVDRYENLQLIVGDGDFIQGMGRSVDFLCTLENLFTFHSLPAGYGFDVNGF
jgi:hypothetical protein